VTETTVFLQPGEMYIGEKPARVKTVVGSCVAICMRDPELNLTAISHCLLPEASGPLKTLTHPDALRYVDSTVELMLAAMQKHGAQPENLEIKLFGGSDAGLGYEVGRRNVEAARRALAAHGLPIARSAVGGASGRALEFDTSSGVVLVKSLAVREVREGG
jgi:chemotaxis protein CheD